MTPWVPDLNGCPPITRPAPTPVRTYTYRRGSAPARVAVAGLGQRHRPYVVIDHRRHAQRPLQGIGEIHVAPAQVDGQHVAALPGIHRAGGRDPDAQQPVARLLRQRGGGPGDPRHDPRGRLARQVEPERAHVRGAGPEVAQPEPHPSRADLDADDVPGAGVQPDLRRRAADAGAGAVRGTLADQALVQELGHHLRHGRGGQGQPPGEVRAGLRAVVAQGAQYEASVQSADVLHRCGHVGAP
ncbi:hypothetical protein GCM10020220_076360 [Nonomuraea rubra]